MSVGEAAVVSVDGSILAAVPAIAVANLAVYDEVRVLSALKRELAALSSGEQGIRASDILLWLRTNAGRDVTGDGVADAADVKALLRRLSPMFVLPQQ